jgi:hypothetical protein
VGQQVRTDDARVAGADHLCRQDELPVAQAEHLGADDACGIEPREERDQDDQRHDAGAERTPSVTSSSGLPALPSMSSRRSTAHVARPTMTKASVYTGVSVQGP